MAEAPGSADNWPGPVTFDDNAKKGYARITLTIDKLEVGFIGSKPKNAKITDNLSDGQSNISEVIVGVTVTDKSGSVKQYDYKKGLPGNIQTTKSNVTSKKGQVIIELCKEENESWNEHARHFVSRN